MTCGAIEKDWTAWIPLDIQKGKDNELRVGGIASDESSPDLQGEKIFVEGLDTSYLLQRGAFNWDHGKNPGDILGEIDTAKKQGSKFYVEGFLYPNVQKAREVFDLMRSLKDSGSKRKLGLSLEGKIKERDSESGRLIKKAWIKNVAITYNPINQGTWVDMIKSLGDFSFSQCGDDCSKCTFCELATEGVKTEVNILKPTEEVATVKKSNEEKTALTLSNQEKTPVLDKSVLTPSEQLIEKADGAAPAPGDAGLKAGHDIPATSGGVSGSALRKESLDKKKKITTFELKNKKRFKKSELETWFKDQLNYSDVMAKAVTDIIFKAHEQPREFTSHDLNQWLQDKMNYTPRMAELMADVIFKSIQVSGYTRTRRGHLERVSPFTKELSHESHRMDTMSERALTARAIKISHPDKMLHFFAAAKDKGMHDLATIIRHEGKKRLGLKDTDFDDVRKEIKYAA